MSADSILASLSVDQLRAGIARGRSQLLLLDSFNHIDPSEDFDGPFPPTKAFEQWEANFDERRRYLLNLGISDCERELARRGDPA